MSVRPGPAEKAESFREALTAIAAPLRFAARDDFARIERIKDLEDTLRRAITRAAMLAGPGGGAALAELAGAIPPPGAAAARRREALRACLARVEGMLASPGAAANLTVPASPAAPLFAPLAATKPRPAPKPGPAGAAPQLATDAAAPPQTPLQNLRGVGPKGAEHLASRGLHTVEDLLRFLPRRYQGFDSFAALGSLQIGAVASVQAVVHGVSYRLQRGRRTLEVILRDDTGYLHLMWFRIPHRNFAEQFVRGAEIRAVGQVKGYRARMQIIHPEITVMNDTAAAPAVDGIVPLYLEVEGMRPIAVRRVMTKALPTAALLRDPLPAALLAARRLPPLGACVAALHQPPQDMSAADLNTMQNPWHGRLIYEELLFLQLTLLQQRATRSDGSAPPVGPSRPLDDVARELLPFTLTGAQSRVLQDVERDLHDGRPMQRLVQGDVGSGKTAVALTAMAAVAARGWQTALLAPTELLAEQHMRQALRLFTPKGLQVGLLTGKISLKERREVLASLADGSLDVVVGTHALLQDGVSFARLGLGVIDEQHRFGVLQRARLRELVQGDPRARGRTPHMLVMTATPIPRTLALTVYGDLDVSKIDALPPGRTPVATHVCMENKRGFVYEQVRAAVQAGQQAYVVFPLVEESDKEGMEQLRDAIGSAEELAHGQLHGLRVGLLHGRMSGDDKDRVMREFAGHGLDVLVATTVIEVGIDVPRATVMVIEHAERFGLSQLHQLRGRVGRGADASSCYLLAQCKRGGDAWQRLDIMAQTNDGFRIAEEDLQIRGMGDVVGTRQAGLPMLSLADLSRDHALLEQARADAQALLRQDPTLIDAQHRGLRESLQRMAGGALRLAKVG